MLAISTTARLVAKNSKMRIMVETFSSGKYVTRCRVYKVMLAAIQQRDYFKLCPLVAINANPARLNGA
ncbi:hypothetical protein IBA8401_23460 [Pseudomonas syringae]